MLAPMGWHFALAVGIALSGSVLAFDWKMGVSLTLNNYRSGHDGD